MTFKVKVDTLTNCSVDARRLAAEQKSRAIREKASRAAIEGARAQNEALEKHRVAVLKEQEEREKEKKRMTDEFERKKEAARIEKAEVLAAASQLAREIAAEEVERRAAEKKSKCAVFGSVFYSRQND